MTLRIMGALVLQPFVAAAAGFLAFPLVDAMNGFSLTNGVEAAISIAVGTGLVAFFVTTVGTVSAGVFWLMAHRDLEAATAGGGGC